MAGFGPYAPPSPPFDFAFESATDDGISDARPDTPSSSSSSPSSNTSSDGQDVDSGDSNGAGSVPYGKKISR